MAFKLNPHRTDNKERPTNHKGEIVNSYFTKDYNDYHSSNVKERYSTGITNKEK